MQEPIRVFDEPRDVHNRLGELGLTEGILLDAVRRGFGAFAACTPNHPRNFPPLAAWAETIRALGESLAIPPRNWSRVDECGQPQILNERGDIAITVAGADANTGCASELQPKTSSSKGPTTVRAIYWNTFLFPEMEREARECVEKQQKKCTWFLLVHRDMLVGQMRCELSKPVAMSEDRHIDGWSERILLKPTDFDSSTVLEIPDGNDQPSAEITLEIKRRA